MIGKYCRQYLTHFIKENKYYEPIKILEIKCKRKGVKISKLDT